MDTYILTRQELKQLEFLLYTKQGSYKDMVVLYNFYQKKQDYMQAGRIRQIIQRFLCTSEKIDENMRTLFVTNKNIQYIDKKIKVFPFTSYENFMNLAYRYNIRLFSYAIKEGNIKDILVHKNIVTKSHEAVQIIEQLCKESNKSFRVMGREANKVRLTESLISNAEDTKYVSDLLEFPAEIAISTLTSECNIRCKFCEQAYEKTPYRETNFDVFRHIISAIPDKKFCNVSLTPFMEPLTSKKFFKYVEIACAMRPYANINFNTNGVLLTSEVSKKLIDFGLKGLTISFNLPDKDSYKNFCGKDFFDTIKKNIYSLYDIRQKSNTEYPKIIIQFLNIPPVVGNEEKIRTVWGPYCDSIYFRNVSVPTGAPEKIKLWMAQYSDLIDTQTKREEGTPCPSMMLTCGIDHMGYYTCCCPLKIERDISGKRKYKYMEIGHVDEMDVATAWKSKKWSELRCQQLAGLLKKCKTCNINQNSEENNLKIKNGVLSYCYAV